MDYKQIYDLAAEAVAQAKKAGERLPKLENKILRSPDAILEYARDVIDGRWAEGEEVLKKNAKVALLYSIEVIRGRFEDAEPCMVQWDEVFELYLKNVLIPFYVVPTEGIDLPYKVEGDVEFSEPHAEL